MNYYTEELQRLQQEIMEKKKVEAKLSDLFIQRAELTERTVKLKKLMQEEQEDVDQIKKGSLASFFYRVSGRLEEKLTKEESEAYAARVKYETAESELYAIESDISSCKSRLESLSGCEKQYAILLEERTEQIKHSSHPEAEHIMRLEKRFVFLENQKKEIREAVTAGEKSLRTVERILEHLDSAKDWSTVDMIGGGLIADLAKYDRLSQVQELTTELQNSLRGFRTELADVTVKISGNIQMEISDFLHFADYFFDGLFTDWIVYDKIKESMHRTSQTQKQIQDILERLRRMMAEIVQEQEQIKKELEERILSSE